MENSRGCLGVEQAGESVRRRVVGETTVSDRIMRRSAKRSRS